MLHLITGGSGSGKSEYAEQQVQESGAGKRIYIATMIPYGEDGRQRVERHRRLRSEKKFETVECYTQLKELSLPEDSIVLLECMSNLVANEIFEPDGAHEQTVNAVMEGIDRILGEVRELFVVTNEIFSDGVAYDEGTMYYMELLGQVNKALAARADAVTEVVCGIPCRIKG